LNDSIDLDDLAGQHILAACSIQHSEKVIKKHLSENTIILSDRSVESNIAYGRAKFGKQVDEIFLSDTRRVYPQVVLFLDIDPELSWSRLMARRKEEFSNNGTDRIEGRGLEFQKTVRQEYLKRATEQMARSSVYLHIDIGGDSIQQVHEKIVRTLKIYGVI
jgi:thymidylate kinase